MGRLIQVWGDATYPVEYVYDATYGWREEMHTWQTGTGFDTAGWPTTPPTPQTTTWGYDDATGLVESKTDDESEHVDYAYTVDGRLAKRTWARTVGTSPALYLITEYLHDSNTGSLTNIKYWRDADGDLSSGATASPDTTNVAFTYDRMGRQKTVTDAVGTRTFNYTVYGELDSETMDGFGTFDYTLDRDQDSMGRDAGFHITAFSYDVDYAYDGATGRFEKVTKGPGLVDSYGVEYAYKDYSDLVEGLSYKDSSGIVVSVKRAYETDRDLLNYVENRIGGNEVVSKYQYHDNDALGRRTSVETTGNAFSGSAGQFNLFGYNDRSELTSSNRYADTYTSTPDPGDEITAEKRLFDYDLIGNREDMTADSATTYYCVNDLNQYDKTSGSDDCPTPTSPIDTFEYDEDGNLTADDKYDFIWNAENRLIRVSPSSPTTGDKTLQFMYDYMGRRAAKYVWTYDGSNWSHTNTAKFIYDGWNVVVVLDDSNDVIRKYTWGLDLSQTLGGAGGIGGLLAAVEDGNSYWFLYDGNGNVGQILDATSTSAIDQVAHYEYDPYGNAIVVDNNTYDDEGTQTGTNDGYANTNPIRFSTKWLDDELITGDSGVVGLTGLYYYGYRYYSTTLGRWTSRDPLEEFLELNLYTYAGNSPATMTDLLGLWTIKDCTATAQSGDTLWGLAVMLTGEGSRWKELQYSGDPRRLRPGDTVGIKPLKPDCEPKPDPQPPAPSASSALCSPCSRQNCTWDITITASTYQAIVGFKTKGTIHASWD